LCRRVTDTPGAGRYSYYGTLGAITVLAVTLRTWGLTAAGVGGNDTIYYYTLAEYWLAGDLVFRIGEGTQVFRPVLLAVNALSLGLFGHTDWAIKAAYVIIDVLNLVLLVALARTVSRSRYVAVYSAATFALLPLAIWASRQELPHTLSTFCVLAAVLSVARSLRAGARRSLRGLAVAGALFGAAALTHEELALLALPLAVFLMLDWPGSPGHGLRGGAARVIAFCAPLLLALLPLLFWQGAAIRELVSGALAAGDGDFYPEVFARFLWNVLAGSTSAVTALLAAACAALLAWRESTAAPERRAGLRWGLFCLLVPAGFVALYAVFFSTIFSRAFLPLVPLLILGIFIALDGGGPGERTPLRRLGLCLLFVVMVVSNFASYSAFSVGNRRYATAWAQPVWPSGGNLGTGLREFLVDARYVPSYATHWRSLFLALEGKVDAAHRLLVLPSTAMHSPGRRPLQTAVYFGDNAVYRLDHPELSLDELVRRFDIGWVVFTMGQQRPVGRYWRRYLYDRRWAPREPIDLAEMYGYGRYSVSAEYRTLLGYLAQAGARPVPAFPAGSYDAEVARLWQLPRAI